MHTKAGEQAPPGIPKPSVRERQLSVLLKLSRYAIAARDVPSFLAHARPLVAEVLSDTIDFDQTFDPNGVLRDSAPDLQRLPPDEMIFLSEVADLAGQLGQQRNRELRAMAEVEGRFGRIFQHSPVALGISTVHDGRVLDVNERWLSVFGFTREEVIGRTNAELRISEGLTDRGAVAKDVRAEGMLREREVKVRTKSGRVLDIIATAVPIDTDDSKNMWLSSLVDITDRKQAEAERDQLLAREQVARAEAEHALEQLRAVYAITDSMAPQRPLGDLLNDLLRRLRQTLQIDHASVFLLEDDNKTLYLRAMEGPDPIDTVPVVRIPFGVGVTGTVAATGKAMIVNDYSSVDASQIHYNDLAKLRATASVMAAPFLIGGQVVGVLAVSTRQPRQFTDKELKLLLFAADRVGPAIERGRLIDRIRTGMSRQRALSRRLLTAQEEERRRLAVELHDELGQVLTAVKINLESLAKARTPAGTFATMAATIQSVDEALLRVRDLALDLRPSVLDDLGLAAAIRWYVDRFARGGPVETHLSLDVLPALEPGLATACFRVTQEALTNVDRHARASHVWIDLHVLDGALELNVRDDGIGFDVAAARARAIGGSSVGLLGMQERVSLVDGEYEVVRVPTGGTTVRARFPLTPPKP